MALSINDIVSKAVSAAAGNATIPANVKETVLNGLSNSVLSSLTQTATKAGGLNQIKELVTGKTNAANSDITKLASQLFAGNVLNKLNLGGSTNTALAGLVPVVMSKLSGFIKDVDGDGDVDLDDILATLKGGKGSGLLGAATSILGGFLKK